METRRVGVRWTIGDVSDRGYAALRLSVWGAYRLFGDDAAYAVCVNTLPTDEAREKAGELPPGVEWVRSTSVVPGFIARHVDPAMAEGVAWKFGPLRLFPDRYELSLDNDCILWAMPGAIHEWLHGAPGRTVIAEDVAVMLGQFQELSQGAPRNSGIRGLPPGYDYEAALRATLERHPVTLESELDEQGLQVVALERSNPPLVVRTSEVAICSPFPPHLPEPGRCGVHFVGLNARRFPWEWEGRNGAEYVHEHFDRWRAFVADRVGVGVEAERAVA